MKCVALECLRMLPTFCEVNVINVSSAIIIEQKRFVENEFNLTN